MGNNTTLANGRTRALFFGQKLTRTRKNQGHANCMNGCPTWWVGKLLGYQVGCGNFHIVWYLSGIGRTHVPAALPEMLKISILFILDSA